MSTLSPSNQKIIKCIIYLSIPGLVILLLIITLVVELGVKKTCEMANQEYPGDKVKALIVFIESSEVDCTPDKARAFWALGQLGDRQALPVLKKHFKGYKEKNSCQYEIGFAIQKIEENRFNLPALLWRNLLDY